jgi:8-hydroxy-5-deazaflavin:NADPH oxidoreductase
LNFIGTPNADDLMATMAILGSGNIGTALARRFAARGIQIGIANTRGADTLADLAAELGAAVVPQSAATAVMAQIVLLAIPFDAVPQATGGLNWTGKIVVDATNPRAPADIRGVSSTADVRACVPGASVVKAFNTLPAAVLGEDPQTSSGRRVLFITSDDSRATNEVAALVNQLGFAAIDLSAGDPDGKLQQRGGPLFLARLLAEP